jgi:hypothetical protein
MTLRIITAKHRLLPARLDRLTRSMMVPRAVKMTDFAPNLGALTTAHRSSLSECWVPESWDRKDHAIMKICLCC